jgi:hypothetical protein
MIGYAGRGSLGVALAFAALSRASLEMPAHVSDGGTVTSEPEPEPVPETRQQRRARERREAKALKRATIVETKP